eukprot:Clim_evm1s82 gene=Clim_evmTU1s82
MASDTDRAREYKRCIFCRIVEGKEPNEILYKDEKFVCFDDIAPRAPTHLLVIPTQCIEDCNHLNSSQVKMVEEMVDVGRQVLRKQGKDPERGRFCFHKPPLILVKHLHLHVLHPEVEMTYFGRFLFWTGTYWCVTADDLINQLKTSSTAGTASSNDANSSS